MFINRFFGDESTLSSFKIDFITQKIFKGFSFSN